MEQKTTKSERISKESIIFENKILNFKEMQMFHREILKKMRETI